MSAVIWHNPACSTSRNVLALLRAAGEDVRVVEYLRTPPEADELAAVIGRLGFGARGLLRRKGTPYDELGLDDPKWTEAELITAMRAHPILINRPVVQTARGIALCRPSDVALDLLAAPPASDLLKEEGVPFLADRPIPGNSPDLAAALAAAGLPVADLAEPGRRFFAYRTLGGTPLGFGGFERSGAEALVRSVVVTPAARGKGIGRNLVALLLRRAFDAGARRAWLLTTTAPDFFAKAGFHRMARTEVPAEILATREAASICPVSAVLMGRTISL